VVVDVNDRVNDGVGRLVVHDIFGCVIIFGIDLAKREKY
jgi:hypothetical protein